MKIKAVASAFMHIGLMVQAHTPKEGLARIESNDPFDLVFVSSCFDPDTVYRFVSEAKATQHGKNSAYILMVRVKEQESSFIVNNIMHGIDGFVLEPLSVDTFIEVVKAAREKVKEGPVELDQGGKKALVRFLIGDAIQQIDMAAFRLAVGNSPGYALKDLKETAAKISNIMHESLDEYFDLLTEAMGNLPPPAIIKNRVTAKKDSNEKKKEKEVGSQKATGYFIRKH